MKNVILLFAFLLFIPESSFSQKPKCGDLYECTQKAVEAAADAKRESEALRLRLAELERRMNDGYWPPGAYCLVRAAEQCPKGFNEAKWIDRGKQPSGEKNQGIGSPAHPYDENRGKGYDPVPLCCKSR